MKTHVVKTSPGATLGEAVDLMDLYQVNGLPVVDAEGVLCGYLAEWDVLHALRGTAALARGGSLAETSVAAVMRTDVVSVSEEIELTQACQLLLRNRLKRIPVTDVRGRVVGVINRIDVLQAILDGTIQISQEDNPSVNTI